MKPLKRRRQVEIYFILYLAALIFLLPDKGMYFIQEGLDNKDKEFQFPFSLQPEKTTLTAKIQIDSSGPKIIELDSINRIFYSGPSKNLDFEFTVIDQSRQASLELTSERPFSSNFRIEERPELGAAFFYWEPPENLRSSKSYLVKVKALLSNEELGNEIRAGENLPVYKTQFSLNVILVTSRSQDLALAGGPDTAQENGRLNFMGFGAPERPSGPVNLSPQLTSIESIAYTEWHMTIFAYGIDLENEALRKPEISVSLDKPNSGGAAYIDNITKSQLVIRGKTPAYGGMEVNVSVARKRDMQNRVVEASTSFRVKPVMFKPPVYPKIVYPGKEYIIKPQIDVNIRSGKAALRLGEEILAENNGENFSFTPDRGMVGKTLYLERYVGNSKYDYKKIEVKEFNNPEIVEIRPVNDNKVEIKTLTHGLLNSRRNEIERFIIEGNAEYSELRGGGSFNDPLYTEQVFEFTPKYPGAPFKFTIVAVDDRGRMSGRRAYN